MITIAELIKRDGKWWGGQDPRPKFKVVWDPGTTFLSYAKAAKSTKAERMLMRELNKPNVMLRDVPWIPRQRRDMRRKTK